MSNPLYNIWAEHQAKYEDVFGLDSFEAKTRFSRAYAWAVPSNEVIEALAQFSPIIEVGAGRGYWAHLLEQAGADVQAFDAAPPHQTPNEWHPNTEGTPRTFTLVRWGSQAVLHSSSPDRALFLCWPPSEDPMARSCLRNYTGNTVIYIGEGCGGCTGDDSFHLLLETEWDLILTFDIPQWAFTNDRVYIYQRKVLNVHGISHFP